MKKGSATNTFLEGLCTDFNPLVTPPGVMTHCLNGTLITYNGNENVLLNDLGNARVETALLPSGYIPVGTASLGGIIYIASYNPLTGKSQVGSFPSPERNLSKKELGDNSNAELNLNEFGNSKQVNWFTDSNKKIEKSFLKLELAQSPIYSGDKFKVFSQDLSKYMQYISGYDSKNTEYDPELYPKYLRLHVISADNVGKNVYLDEGLTWTQFDGAEGDLNKFYVLPKNIKLENGKTDLEEYRDLINANYDVYNSKLSGKLGLIASLEAPSTFSVAYDAVITDDTTDDTTDSLVKKKKALLYFYLNWSNTNKGEHKSRVNPSRVKVKTTVGAKSNTIDYDIGEFQSNNTILPYDALENIDAHAINIPDDYYQSNFDIVTYLENWPVIPSSPGVTWFSSNKRKNDGTDFLYIVEGPTIEYETNTSDHAIIEVTPCMPYGQLLYLTQTIDIELSKLGTGEINLHGYSYYVDDNKITFNWQLLAYPELNKRITNVWFNFIPFKEFSDNLLGLDTYLKVHDTNPHKKSNKEIKQQSYTGNITTLVEFNENFKKDSVYVNSIVIEYGDKYIEMRRITYTSDIFNSAFGVERDFKNLYLYDPNESWGIKPQIYVDGLELKSEVAEYPDLTKEIGSSQNEPTLKEGTIDFKCNTSFKGIVKLDSGVPNISLTILNGTKPNIDGTISTKDQTIKIVPNTFSPQIGVNTQFNVQMNYSAKFDTVKESDLYGAIPIVGADGHVDLALQTKKENWGKLYMTDLSRNEWVVENYCPDQQHRIWLADPYAKELNKIANEYKLDYINIWLGVNDVKDDDHLEALYIVPPKGEGKFYVPSRINPTGKGFFLTYIRKRNSNGRIYASSAQNLRNAFLCFDKNNTAKWNGTYDSTVFDKNNVLTSKAIKYYKYEKLNLRHKQYTLSGSPTYPRNPVINIDRIISLNEQDLELTIYNIECDYKDNKDYPKNLSLRPYTSNTKITDSLIIETVPLFNQLLFSLSDLYLQYPTEYSDTPIILPGTFSDIEKVIFVNETNKKMYYSERYVLNDDGYIVVDDRNSNISSNVGNWYSLDNNEFRIIFAWEDANSDDINSGQLGIALTGLRCPGNVTCSNGMCEVPSGDIYDYKWERETNDNLVYDYNKK